MRRSLLTLGGLAVSAAFVMLATAAPSPAATFTVTTAYADTDDGPHDVSPGDGVCANPLGACGIEAVIDEANATPGVDAIAFDLPSSEPVDFFLNLVVTEPVVIDGTTEPDFVSCERRPCASTPTRTSRTTPGSCSPAATRSCAGSTSGTGAPTGSR